jgi:hypothetical protein
MPYPGHTTEEVARRGREIYARRIRHEVEPEHEGRFVVVDVTTGAWEIAEDDLVASDRALAKNPDAVLYFARVGHPAAYRLGVR